MFDYIDYIDNMPPWVGWVWIGAGCLWVTVIITAAYIDRKRRDF